MIYATPKLKPEPLHRDLETNRLAERYLVSSSFEFAFGVTQQDVALHVMHIIQVQGSKCPAATTLRMLAKSGQDKVLFLRFRADLAEGAETLRHALRLTEQLQQSCLEEARGRNLDNNNDVERC